MIGFIRDVLRRRTLRPVVKALPHVLCKRYGRDEFYTVGQVRASAELLKLKPDLFVSAFAVACTAYDFAEAQPEAGQQDYRGTRAAIAQLFRLEESELNCRALTSRFRSPPGIATSLDPSAAFHDRGTNSCGGSSD